jgi:hypothetical protein
MESWGMRNGQLHSFDFGRVGNNEKFVRQGWLNEKASGHIISPVKDNLVFEVLGWTPSTKGTVTGQVVHIVAPQGPIVETPAGETPGGGRGGGRGGQGGPQRLGPTQEELDKYLASLAPRMKNAMVMIGGPAVVGFQETPPAKRRVDEDMRRQYNPDPNAPPAPGRGGRQGTPPAQPAGGRGAQPAAPAGPARLSAGQVNNAINAFVLKSGAAVRLNDGAREHGQIRAFNGTAYDPAQNLPTAVLRNEDYGRIARIVAGGTPVTLEFNIQNRMYPEGKTSYNAIAEIPGTDKADEVVMLGGHLDSWHSATGATDNAIGCAVMMEAARILQTIGVKPRRTIRVALWGGEEQGLLGSQAYVRDTFGSAENPKPAWHKFNGYFNVDSGTGRIRGGSVFGPPEAAQVLGQFLKQFEDLGVYGATAMSSRATGGSDHTSFNNAGLPGIGLGQDPIEYNSHTWHTNLDTYERIVWEDVKKSAVAVASAVYHLANREQMLPRFAPSQMPALPGGRGGGAPGQR